MLRANAHYFDVTMEIPLSGTENQLVLVMPTWTPGHYLVEEFARHVDEVKAFDAVSGAKLDVTKVSKASWLVVSNGTKWVRVAYSAYAFSYVVDASYLDSEHALLNGASLFLYVEGMKENRVRLKLIPSAPWKNVSTGLESVGEWEFTAPDYDVLIDSPLEVGNQEVSSFDVEGARFEVSVFGKVSVDTAKFIEDLQAIVEKTITVIGQVPFKRYVFLVNFTESAVGGLEHLNSTMCFVPRFRMMPREEYNLMMGIFSHEFFHAWNVKRMRPNGLGPFNYTSETYTRSLWIAEGITSYYDDLILRRAGLYSVEEYLDAFVMNINLMAAFPGSRKQSAEESSFDAWTKFYKPDENSPNAVFSYYTQGAVIGWMLDMTVRKKSEGQHNLDDAMRKLYSETFLKNGRGYTDNEFEAACVSFGGPAVSQIFNSRVRGRAEVDYDQFLGYVGLRLAEKENEKGPKGFLGASLASEGGRKTTLIKAVLASTPAEDMALAVNDEIIAIDGIRVTAERLVFLIATMAPGREIALTVARNGMLKELRGQVGKKPVFQHRIQPRRGASKEERELFKGWLLSEWKEELQYPDYARSPDRKQLLEFV